MKLGTATTFANGKLTYHNTIVCEDLGDGRTRLNSGGRCTVTTKRRMNQYAEAMGYSWNVYQHKKKWFVENYSTTIGQYVGVVLDFSDGMEVEGK